MEDVVGSEAMLRGMTSGYLLEEWLAALVRIDPDRILKR